MSCYGSRKAVVEKCTRFEKGNCFDMDCEFLHNYKYCFQFQNTTCRNQKCPFLHCTGVEQLRYETTGKPTDNLKREVGRTLQSTNICGDFKKNVCKRTKCKRRHVKLDDIEPLECPVCRDEMIIENFGAGYCGHIFCMKCAFRLLNDEVESGKIKVNCPICRQETIYKKLM
ncbi:PREDICTED: uncharacterized protein LOC105460802 [Wasmannia auropunctata]|uniref:uncharacterized protein LOC105460802 n=1 Tax=Wasmannia auropunctata TaxID=64793 RepID=UPI0005EE5B5B|nr:PREDICTED: uncharacterized protein LOC105460802 [Wasmannia auropunctata]